MVGDAHYLEGKFRDPTPHGSTPKGGLQTKRLKAVWDHKYPFKNSASVIYYMRLPTPREFQARRGDAVKTEGV